MNAMQIVSKESYKTRNGIEVSPDRFAEIVSLYFDNLASKEELLLLAQLVEYDMRAQRIFRQSCRVHLATCRMFGKEAVRLQSLPFEEPARRATRKAAVEWSFVAAFMVVCLVFFKLSQTKISESDFTQVIPELTDVPSFDAQSLNIADSYLATKDSCSVIYITR